MAFPWTALATALGGYLGYKGAKASSSAAQQASQQASGLSAEQEAMLRALRQWREQYGGPMLEKAWGRVEAPYETPYDRLRYERGRERISQAYQPVYAQKLAQASQRGMLTDPNSWLGSQLYNLDRARAGAVSDWAMEFMDPEEEARRLAAFGDLLSQLTGGQIGAAQAYEPAISRYADVAQQTAGGMYDPLAALAQLLAVQQMSQQQAPTAPGPTLTNIEFPWPLQYNPWG